MHNIPNRLEVNTDLNIVPADSAERAVRNDVGEHRGVVPLARPRTLDKLVGVICPIKPNLRLVGPSDHGEGSAKRGGMAESTCCSVLAVVLVGMG